MEPRTNLLVTRYRIDAGGDEYIMDADTIEIKDGALLLLKNGKIEFITSLHTLRGLYHNEEDQEELKAEIEEYTAPDHSTPLKDLFKRY